MTGLALTLVAAAWASALPLVPWLAAHDHLAGAGAVMATVVYATGRVVCHQRSERSFHPWGRQMPVCARCAGLYVAAPVGILLAWRRVRPREDAWGSPSRRPWSTQRLRLYLLVAAAPTMATVMGETVGLILATNALRTLSALPLGLAIGWTIGLAVTFGIAGPRVAPAVC